jgi:hypothetical protein
MWEKEHIRGPLPLALGVLLGGQTELRRVGRVIVLVNRGLGQDGRVVEGGRRAFFVLLSLLLFLTGRAQVERRVRRGVGHGVGSSHGRFVSCRVVS